MDTKATDSFGLPLPDEASLAASMDRLTALGQEYNSAVTVLSERIKHLESLLRTVPLSERPMLEERILVLRREIRQSRDTGADAAGYYTAPHLFLPKKKKGGYISC